MAECSGRADDSASTSKNACAADRMEDLGSQLPHLTLTILLLLLHLSSRRIFLTNATVSLRADVTARKRLWRGQPTFHRAGLA